MHSPQTGAETTSSVQESVTQYGENRPALRPILEAFKSVLEERAALARAFAAEAVALPDMDPERFGHGVFLLAEMPLTSLAGWIDASWRAMLPALERAMPTGKGFALLRKAFATGDADPVALCQAFLDRNQQPVLDAAGRLGIEPGIAHYGVETVLGPVLAGVAAQAAPHVARGSWNQGTCPICGSFPSVAYLARPEPTEVEALVGGGGQKYLHCSLCGHEWRFRRDACPACGNHDPGSRRMIHEKDQRHERVEACTKCNAYFLCIDLRELAVAPDMHVAPLGLMHLDVVARKEGFVPVAPAPWNAPETSS
ncbi:MAG: formate dehydrogenase accessory protein FdhE [Desulfovibrionaceae bacterium]